MRAKERERVLYRVIFNAGSKEELDVRSKVFDTLTQARNFAAGISGGFGIWKESNLAFVQFIESGLPKGAHEKANSQRVAQAILPATRV